jgi:branched-subunit amino acid aminotransferase/4-amino-4-deoxychorismate lyase
MHASDARISVFDSGFLMGVNVFDTIAVWNGWLFKLDAHVDRFYRSAHAIRLELPYSKVVFKELVIVVTRRAGFRDAYVQCVATRGVRSHMPSSEWAPDRHHFCSTLHLVGRRAAWAGAWHADPSLAYAQLADRNAGPED